MWLGVLFHVIQHPVLWTAMSYMLCGFRAHAQKKSFLHPISATYETAHLEDHSLGFTLGNQLFVLKKLN